MLQDRRPVIISGPSGVGKGTLIDRLFNAHPDVFALTVSHTTRPPRPGEVEGRNYYYVSREDFASLIAQDAMVEYTEFSGNYYGTSKQTVADQESKGRVVVLDIEMHGIQQIKANKSLDARCVFIKPPSFEELEQRLRQRGTETEEEVQRRLRRAKYELDSADSAEVYDLVIVNDDLDRAFREVEKFVFGTQG